MAIWMQVKSNKLLLTNFLRSRTVEDINGYPNLRILTFLLWYQTSKRKIDIALLRWFYKPLKGRFSLLLLRITFIQDIK